MRNRMMRNRSISDSGNVNWVLWGTVIAAAAAGVIYYLNNKEEVNDRLSNLKDKASDALGSARTRINRRVDEVRSQVQG